jgi:TPR repeat protein
MSRIDFPKIYNPAYLSADELIENFVVRTRLFQDIFKDIKNSKMKYPGQHYIVQGLRGQGKTTLLLRIAYEIERDLELRKRIVPVVFNEEQYNITRLYKLWENIALYLDEHDETKGLHNELQMIENDADYERRCFDRLEKSLKKQDKKIILFIDNIDELFDKFSDLEHKRMREVLIESAEIRIIGTTSVGLEFHYDYGKPFYQFFKVNELRGLDSAETKTLLLKLGECYKFERVKEIVNVQPGRVEALRRITGGVIRTIVLLFEIFIDDENGDAFRDLEHVLDIVTPLYKHRMDKLSPQQQEIVHTIAIQWDAISTKEIAKKIKMESKAVSAQLNQLEKYHIIEKEKIDKKNQLYRIHERFFNIWYLMRYGQKWDEKRVRFLVEFLQCWCDENELGHRAFRHLEAVHQRKICDNHAFYLTEALARTSISRELQDKLIHKTKDYLKECNSKLLENLSASDLELRKSAIESIEHKDPEKAIINLLKINVKLSDDFAMLGNLYASDLNDFKKAKQYYNLAIKMGHAEAMNNLALLYENEKKDMPKAEKYFLMAVEKGIVGSMNNLAWLFFEEKKEKEKALLYAKNSYKKEKSAHFCHTYSMILLWHNEIEKAYEISRDFINDNDLISRETDSYCLFLIFLMAKKQYHLVLRIFNENPNDLKDRFKPIYYALMHFMKKEYPKEYRKMGGELKQTVEEVIQKVQKMAKDYA